MSRDTSQPTGQSLDPRTMAELGQLVENAARGQPVDAQTMDRLAREHGVDASHLYASAAVTTTVSFAREHKVSFVVCGGTCQEKGALVCLQHLLELRRARDKAWFKKSFNVEARGCLDRCDHAPVVRVHSRHGVAYLMGATKEELSDAVKSFC